MSLKYGLVSIESFDFQSYRKNPSKCKHVANQVPSLTYVNVLEFAVKHSGPFGCVPRTPTSPRRTTDRRPRSRRGHWRQGKRVKLPPLLLKSLSHDLQLVPKSVRACERSMCRQVFLSRCATSRRRQWRFRGLEWRCSATAAYAASAAVN